MQPQLEERALRGLADTLAVILERFAPDHTTAVPFETLRTLFQEESSGIEMMERIRLAAEPARRLTDSLRWTISEAEERTYWFTRLEEQVQAWIRYFDRYLRWADVLLAPPDEFLLPLGKMRCWSGDGCFAICLPGASCLDEKRTCFQTSCRTAAVKKDCLRTFGPGWPT